MSGRGEQRLRSTLYDFDEERLDSIIRSGFEDFRVVDDLENAEMVFIKPNLVSDVPEYIQNGSNTDVRVLEAILDYLQDYSVEVKIGESDTGSKTKGRKLEKALEVMGVYSLQDDYDFEIVNLTEDEWVTVDVPDGRHLDSIELGKTHYESDLIINTPKIKTHKYATVTCSLKNMFGTVPDPLRVVYHEDIHRVLCDLNSIFNDKVFTVVDGIRGMEGNGPLYGRPVDLECLLFSDSQIAADTTACRIMEIDPEEVKHLSLFREQTGTTNVDLTVEGPLPLEQVSRPFDRANKNLFVKMEGKLMQHRPIVRFFFNDWVRRNITYYLNPLFSYLRGGSYSWYVDEEESNTE